MVVKCNRSTVHATDCCNLHKKSVLRKVMFVSGWGLENSLWATVQNILTCIPNLICTTIEFGSTLPFIPISAELPCLAVGHSVGFLWLMKERPLSWEGLVAVNGFTRFLASADFPQGVKAHLLERMIYLFDQNPTAVTNTFLRRCGMLEVPTLQQLSHLRQGLIWLRDWNVESEFAAELTPRLVLAGGIDPIVTPAMTEACFSRQSSVEIAWQQEGGHLLPLSHPLWLAMQLWVFMKQLWGDNIPAPPFSSSALWR